MSCFSFSPESTSWLWSNSACSEHIRLCDVHASVQLASLSAMYQPPGVGGEAGEGVVGGEAENGGGEGGEGEAEA